MTATTEPKSGQTVATTASINIPSALAASATTTRSVAQVMEAEASVVIPLSVVAAAEIEADEAEDEATARDIVAVDVTTARKATTAPHVRKPVAGSSEDRTRKINRFLLQILTTDYTDYADSLSIQLKSV